ncbi:MraY family glycosyltransferase [Pseudohalioglobus lutimaris]|uniref:Glycosyl transferase n=1 Tax=Pseudohalioglobus lutimaris TaxID=1737061 RepID=A0A2N5X5M9_9GAMM|nr:glycosyltransferase family 4 protein [Pseudohalioglobus lutimaris]PLW69771.1 glycosyl transferase [Pseudohalioglobus lutimaris]
MAPLLTMILSACLCGGYLILARRWQILDLPNERSSHAMPTPHGGGVPTIAALLLGTWLASAAGVDWGVEYLVMLGTAAALVVIGVVDDLRSLGVGLRFALYSACSLIVVNTLYHFILEPSVLAWALGLLTVVALLWLLNLYNFMDGIDAFAAVQCMLACAGAWVIASQSGADPAYRQFCLLLLAAQAGFLVWNWPPAKLFMGDAGSVPTGLLLGALALLGSVRGYLPLACWLILLGPFIVDASATLAWRIATGQRFTQPHRLHAYQRLSRRYGGHRPVVLMLIAIVVLWLFPLAWLAGLCPKYGLFLVILAYLPLLAGMAKTAKLG